MESEYELRLSGGKVVKWTGSDGVNAAERYVDAHQGTSVIAWREISHGVFPYSPSNVIIEPGDKEMRSSQFSISSFSTSSGIANIIIESVRGGMDLDEAISAIRDEAQEAGVPDDTIKEATEITKDYFDEK